MLNKIMWNATRVTIILLAGLQITGCASIIGGSRQNVSFNSAPSGAVVNVSGKTGVTPITLSVRRRSPGVATFQKDGYAAATYPLDRGFNGWVFGNLIFGGIPGLIIDLITGAVHDVHPDSVFVSLTPLNNASQQTSVQPIVVQPAQQQAVQPIVVQPQAAPQQQAPINYSQPRQARPAAQAKGNLRIDSDIVGAEVMINGRFVGNAPVSVMLDPGNHVVEVYKANYNRYRREITIMSGSESTLTATLSP